jgi:hypothetical protein
MTTLPKPQIVFARLSPLFFWALLFFVSFSQAQAAGLQTKSERADSSDYLPATPGFSDDGDCRGIDLRPMLAKYKSQGDTSFCYAYTSAELIRQRTGVSVSALELASDFYFTDPRLIEASREPRLREFVAAHADFSAWIERFRSDDGVDIEAPEPGQTAHPMFHKLEGGYEAPTLMLANAQGLCLDLSVPSTDGFKHLAPMIQRAEKAALSHSVQAGHEVDVVDPRFRDAEADIFNSAWLRYLTRTCKRVQSPVLLLPVEFGLAQSLKEYRLKNAGGAISRAEKRRLLSSLDFSLENRRIAAIGFNLNAILDPGSQLRGLSTPNNIDPDAGDHSSPIVARKKIGGTCSYLIRDPSGNDCEDYRKDLRAGCSNHEVWVSDTTLLESSFYGLVYLR